MAHYFPSGLLPVECFVIHFLSASVELSLLDNTMLNYVQNYFSCIATLRTASNRGFLSKCMHMHYLCTLCVWVVQPIGHRLTACVITEAQLDM